jgi:hypothetical protein
MKSTVDSESIPGLDCASFNDKATSSEIYFLFHFIRIETNKAFVTSTYLVE